MAPNGQKLLSSGPLLDARGMLVEAGYATALVRRYDRAAIRAWGLRIKEWDYYCIIGGDMVLALTIADNSYMGLESVSLINLGTRWQHTQLYAPDAHGPHEPAVYQRAGQCGCGASWICAAL